MPYTIDQFENADLWKIYEATIGISTDLEIGVTPIIGGGANRVLFETSGNLLGESANFIYNDASSYLGVNSVRPVSGSLQFTDSSGNNKLQIGSQITVQDLLNVSNIQGVKSISGDLLLRQNAGSDISFINSGLASLWKITSGGNIESQNTTSQLITAGAQFSRSGATTWVSELGNDLYVSGDNVSGYGIAIDSGAITDPTAYPDALVSFHSTGAGVLFPRMTTAQKTAIAAPNAGLQVYDTTLNQMSYYNGSAWVNF